MKAARVGGDGGGTEPAGVGGREVVDGEGGVPREVDEAGAGPTTVTAEEHAGGDGVVRGSGG